MAAECRLRPILLIDDNHEDLYLQKRLLVREGVTHPIVTIDGGEEALAFLRAAILPGAEGLLPLVIFCDVKMPMVTGFEVLAWARQQPTLKGVPFYIVSSSALEADQQRASELGATDFLVKFPGVEVYHRLIQLAEGAANLR